MARYEVPVFGNDMSRSDWSLHRNETLSYVENLRKNGTLIAGEALRSARTASTVRVCSGNLFVTVGPFAQTNEQLGGFFLINARDAAESIQIASKWPSARIGSIEVRPIEEELPQETRYAGITRRVGRRSAPG